MALQGGRGPEADRLAAMGEGFRAHGHRVEVFDPLDMDGYDLVAFGGMALAHDPYRDALAATGRRWLVVDLGYIGDRREYSQVGWDRIGWMPPGDMPPDRFEAHGIEVRDDRLQPGPWLVVGQVPGDTQHPFDEGELMRLYRDLVWRLRKAEPGCGVVFRSHPHAPQNLCSLAPHVRRETGNEVPLLQSLQKCRAAVTYNSTTWFEAAVEGVPFVCHESAHYAAEGNTYRYPSEKPIGLPQLYRADEKLPRFYRAAYAQWTKGEMASGRAWDFLHQFC